MRAGFGRSDLTPPMGVELAGYGYYLGRCARSVRDPLYARALLLEDSGIRAMVVCCDLLGLSDAVCRDVLAHARQYGVTDDHAIIVSVHTHTGPTIKYHEGCGYVSDDYVATVAARICLAVDAAAADLDEVTGITGTSRAFGGDHIYNRTVEDGPVDRTARGFILSREGKPPIAMVSAACHGVFNGRIPEVSADFSGEICRRLDAMGYCGLYVNGLCGDIDPYRPTPDRMAGFAQTVLDAFFEAQHALPQRLTAGSIPFTLRLTSVTMEEIKAAAAQAVQAAGGADMPAARVALIWEKEMLDKLHMLSDSEEITVEYLLLGGVPVAALPFEGFTRIGQDIRSICGREDALILGCGRELLGYMPTRDDIHRGAYAALESTFLYKRLPVVPGEAERLGEEIGAALERILHEAD